MVLASSRFDQPLISMSSPLPGTIDDILVAVKDILELGRIQALQISMGGPIKYFQASPESTDGELLEAQIRNVELLEYVAEGHSSFEKMIGMSFVASSRGRVPACFVTGPNVTDLFSRWMMVDRYGLPRDIGWVLGVPIIRVGSVEEDVLLLCCADDFLVGPTDINLVIKTDIDLSGVDYGVRETGNSLNDRVRVDPSEHDRTNDLLEATPEGGFGLGWFPRGILG